VEWSTVFGHGIGYGLILSVHFTVAVFAKAATLRPEGDETWEQTSRREVREEARAPVVEARFLGSALSEYIAEPSGTVLVRSIWPADVTLDPWDPRHDIPFRRVVAPADVAGALDLAKHPFAPIVRRALHEARVAGC
jgi:8-oxo-dGTP pyrophosphatase MutT (NUDIX family)